MPIPAESYKQDDRHFPETSPLREVYATWDQRFQDRLIDGWRRKLAMLVPELRQLYPNKALHRAVKQGDQLLGLPPEFWVMWEQGYIEDIWPFMDEAARVSADLAGTDVRARFSISAEPGIVESDIASWAHQHTMRLVRKRSRLFRQTLTQTDIRALQSNISAWVETGGTFPDLVDRISGVVVNPNRARMIASTEATRAYANGQELYWRATGVVNARRWNTARDELVCPVCRPLDANTAALGDPFAGGIDKPPAHVQCRCWITPVVIRLDKSRTNGRGTTTVERMEEKMEQQDPVTIMVKSDNDELAEAVTSTTRDIVRTNLALQAKALQVIQENLHEQLEMIKAEHRAETSRMEKFTEELYDIMKHLAEPPPITINVESPKVDVVNEVETPTVEVQPPKVEVLNRVEPANVVMDPIVIPPANVEVNSQPPSVEVKQPRRAKERQRVRRDSEGRIIETETDIEYEE